MYRFIHIFTITLLVWVAWLQVNDPDPIFWVGLYLFASLSPLMHLLNRPRFQVRIYLLGLAGGFCLAGLTLVIEGAAQYLNHMAEESLVQDMSPEKPYIEEARELIGSLIALAIVATYSLLAWRKSQGHRK